MDSCKFPDDLESELGGLTFGQAFAKCPKIVEFVRVLWLEENCSGIYLDFYKYCKGMLKNPMVCAEHETRCYDYVKKDSNKPTANYMVKYDKKENECNRTNEI
jgi:hypothetical protein